MTRLPPCLRTLGAMSLPVGAVQFYASLNPALPPGAYTLSYSQSVLQGQTQIGAYPAVEQAIAVQGPQFSLPAGASVGQYPPPNGADAFDAMLPYIVLADPTLPWERDVDPTATGPVSTPWLALLLLRADEFATPASTTAPLESLTVAELIAGSDGVLGPALTVDQDTAATACQAITIPGPIFQALAPTLSELAQLCHYRAINLDTEQATVSVVIGNRLPCADGSAQRYFAHLVSLEGYQAYLATKSGPGAALPTYQGNPVAVRLCSLANWSFVSQPEPALSFGQLMHGLANSQSATATLAVPAPESLPQAARTRLSEGFVPINFSSNGADSFSWYRGPLTATQAQPLPAQIGAAQVAPADASSADALTIYLQAQGVFDISYAAAWQIGRALALSSDSFRRALHAYRLAARRHALTMARRAATPLFARVGTADTLLRRGIGWHRAAELAASEQPLAAPPLHPRTMLADDEVVSAIATALEAGGQTGPVAGWLHDLSLLRQVPFSHLVPAPAMLPPESIRFFFFDTQWTDAAMAGALSLFQQGVLDQTLQTALRPHLSRAISARRDGGLREDASPPVAGLLIRSQLVSAYPTTVIAASAGQQTATILRDEALSPDVRLCLLDRIPDRVTLSQPYHAFGFGLQSDGILLRRLNDGPVGQSTGKYLTDSSLASFLATYCRPADPCPYVVNIDGLSDALAQALGIQVLTSDGFAIQLVCLPEQQIFAAG